MTAKLWPIKIKYNYIVTLSRPDYLYHKKFRHITKWDVFLTRNSHINLKAECIFPIYIRDKIHLDSRFMPHGLRKGKQGRKINVPSAAK